MNYTSDGKYKLNKSWSWGTLMSSRTRGARQPEQEALPWSNQSISPSSHSLFSSSSGSAAIQGWAGTQHFLDGLVSSPWAGHVLQGLLELTPVPHQRPQPRHSCGRMPEGQCSRVQVIQKLFWMFERQGNKTNSRNYSSGLLKSRFFLAQTAAWQDPEWKCPGWERGPREIVGSHGQPP